MPNGVALFAGPSNGIDVVRPSRPVPCFTYRCGSEYHVDVLREMLVDPESVGIVVIDSRESTVATVNGTTITVHVRMTSGVGGKHDKGGQSQNRFHRLHEEGVKQFQGRVAEKMNAIFLERPGVKKIVVAGPSFCKNGLVEDKHLDYRVKNRIAGLVDIGCDGDAGVREALHRSGGLLDGIEYNRQRGIVQKFMESISKDDGLATYGINEIREDLRKGMIAMLLLSDGLDAGIARELNGMALETGAKTEVISGKTEDGAMLLKGFGGVAGIRRF